MRKAITILVLLLMSTPTMSNELGEELVTFSCSGCHGDDMYTRENRKTQNIHQLIGRVKGCNRVAATEWNSEQIDAVVKYLNDTFYHFE